jgi:hypothetical protein
MIFLLNCAQYFKNDNMRTIIIFCLAIIFSFSCTEKKKENLSYNGQKDSVKAALTQPEKTLELPTFVFKTGQDESGNPTTTVELQHQGKSTTIGNLTGNVETIAQEKYKEYDIPSNALGACFVWWAGSGDYYYLISENQQYTIYKGWQDEQQEDKGYHWEKHLTIK